MVKILRFPTAQAAETQWLMRQQEGEGQIETVVGEQLLVTQAGRQFRPGAKASVKTVELKSGRYLVRVAELCPEKRNTEIGFALKQLEKIRNLREPDGADSLAPLHR